MLHFEDEFPENGFIVEFIGLRAKSYCYITFKGDSEENEFVKAKRYNAMLQHEILILRGIANVNKLLKQ